MHPNWNKIGKVSEMQYNLFSIENYEIFMTNKLIDAEKKSLFRLLRRFAFQTIFILFLVNARTWVQPFSFIETKIKQYMLWVIWCSMWKPFQMIKWKMPNYFRNLVEKGKPFEKVPLNCQWYSSIKNWFNMDTISVH